MSVSKWRWTPECDKGICVGDCDLCDKAEVTKMDKRTETFLNLVKEHPDLPIIPMVEAEIVNGEDCGYWMGQFGYSEIQEVFLGRERLHVKGDDDPEEVLEDLPDCKQGCLPDGAYVYDLTDEEINRFYNQIEWHDAIVVYITM